MLKSAAEMLIRHRSATHGTISSTRRDLRPARLAALAFAIGLLASSGWTGVARAQGSGEDPAGAESAEAPGAAPPPRPALRLDSILRPRSVPEPSGRNLRGGRGRAEWAERFASLRREIGELELRVTASRERMANAADASIQYSPVGGGAVRDPEMLKLSAQLRRDEETLETAKRRLRDLEVEASLAGVPREWFEEKEREPASR